MNLYVVIGLLVLSLLGAVATVVAMRRRLLKYLGGLISLYTRLEVERTFAIRRGDDVEVIDEMLDIATDALSELPAQVLGKDKSACRCGHSVESHIGGADQAGYGVCNECKCPQFKI